MISGNKKGPRDNETLVFDRNCLIIKWAQLGTIQRPLDYESSALTS